MKRVADGSKPVVVVPPVLKPIEVEVPLIGVAPEFGDIAVAVAVLPD